MATVTTSWKAAPAVTAVARSAQLLRTMEEIDAAMARFEAGAYGRCVSCGSAMPGEPLEFRPCAATCVTCQQPAA